MMKLVAAAWTCFAPTLFLHATCSNGQDTIAELAATDPESRFTTLLDLATLAGLAQTPLGNSLLELTLLAPTNDAFELLTDQQVYYLRNNAAELTKILAYHLIEQEIFTDNIPFGNGVTLSTYHTLPRNTRRNARKRSLVEEAVPLPTEFPTETPMRFAPSSPIAPAFLPVTSSSPTSFPTLVAALDPQPQSPSTSPSAPPTFIENNDTPPPSQVPTSEPSTKPTQSPSQAPLLEPTKFPSPAPSGEPTLSPTNAPEPGPPLNLRRFWYWSWSHFRYLYGVTINSGEAYVVEVADLDANNGVIHAIGNVLLPPGYEFPPETLVNLATSVNDLSTLIYALQVADLVDTLNDYRDTYTVFCPTNDAFDSFNNFQDGLLTYLIRNPDTLKTVLLHHVLEGAVLSTDIEAAGTTLSPTTLQGETIDVVFQPGTGVIVNDNSAIDESLVIDADNIAMNGVAHIVDTVLIPDEIANALPIPNVVETVVATTRRLTNAVTAAELVDALLGEGPFTVFAPSDQAFGGLGSSLEELFADPTGELSDILLYHVVHGYVSVGLLEEFAPAEISNLNGARLVVRRSGVNIILDDNSGAFTTIEQSIPCINGIVHIVNKVLIPPPPPCPYNRFWCWLIGWD